MFTVGSGPVHPAYASRHFTTLCHWAGVRVIRLHDLRHTSASLGLAAGEPLLHVSRRLGHSSIAVTADVYTQVTPQAAKTAADHFRKQALRLWRAHLATLESSPVYETVLLAIVELTLGHRLDLQQLLTRLIARLRRNPPELSDPDGWAY